MRVLFGSIGAFAFLTPVVAAEPRLFEAEAAQAIEAADKIPDATASGGSLISLGKAGQGVRFSSLPRATKLAIRYASVEAGTISVVVNDAAPRKVNVHSSGALTGSFLHAIIDVVLPVNGALVVNRAPDDVAVNIDRILVGEGNLGLPPDIWNLPPMPVADGTFPPDWKLMSRTYTVPEWWRDAKFGAWSHWTPQSMPERGDWYARKMYLERDPVYAFHVRTFGHPSEYGYKDIAHNWVIDRWTPDDRGVAEDFKRPGRVQHHVYFPAIPLQGFVVVIRGQLRSEEAEAHVNAEIGQRLISPRRERAKRSKWSARSPV